VAALVAEPSLTARLVHASDGRCRLEMALAMDIFLKKYRADILADLRRELNSSRELIRAWLRRMRSGIKHLDAGSGPQPGSQPPTRDCVSRDG